MAGSRTDGLRRNIERALPDRPFTIELWDGSRVPSTRHGPTLTIRSPRAIGHVLRAPGRARARPCLRLRRDRGRRPGRGDRPARPLARAPRSASRSGCGSARRRCAPRAPIARPRPPPPSCARARRRAHQAARRGGRPAPLRRLERVLRAVPGRDDDLQLRAVRAGDRDAGGRPARQARADLPQAQARARPAHARHRLRLGKPGDPRRARARRLGLGNHALRAAGGAGEGAGARGGRGRPGRVQGDGLPRPARGALRRGGQHRHGRARRRVADRRVRPRRSPTCWNPAVES